MLFKSNKFFDLKSKRTSVKLVKSINLCQFFNFLLHITGKICHILRFNYLEMCYILVYLLILGFPIVEGGGGHGGAPPPPSYDFLSKTSLIKFWGAPPMFGTPVGNSVYICETQVHNCTKSIIFGIPHPKVLWQAHLFTFSN